jgi:hypothetical protein
MIYGARPRSPLFARRKVDASGFIGPLRSALTCRKSSMDSLECLTSRHHHLSGVWRGDVISKMSCINVERGTRGRNALARLIRFMELATKVDQVLIVPFP